MISHYLLITWRSLWKNKAYSFIHVFGLSIALITCLLLTAFVIQELQFDKIHEKGNRIHRLNVDLKVQDQELNLALAAGIMAPSLKNDFPEVESFVRLASPWSDPIVSYDNQTFFEKNALYADETFFEVFDFKLKEGNAGEVLKQANQVVFTQRMAEKYFGKQNPVGESILINDELFAITGIAENPLQNSHIDFDYLISFKTWIKEHPAAETNWTWTSSPTYLVLSDKADYQQLNTRLDSWLKAKLPDGPEQEMHLSLQPFESIHFSPARLGDLKANGSRSQLWLLSFVGLLILFIALFNYINLATALYSGRAKEIGIRKSFGARKGQIILQFIFESVLLVGFSIACAFTLTAVGLPWFNQMLGTALSFDFVSPLMLVSGFLILVVVIGSLAGFYPSLLASGWTPLQLFSGRRTGGEGRFSFKQVLICAQFGISIGLIITTLVIWNQYQFMTDKNLGFNKDHKLILRFGSMDKFTLSLDALKSEMKKLPEVKGITFSSHIPSENTHGVYTQITNNQGEVKAGELELTLVDPDFLNVFDIPLIAGRGFSPEMASDSVGALIVNEATLRHLGFNSPQEIIGSQFSQWDKQGKVIGVIKDYNQHSLHTSVAPMTFQMNQDLFEKVTIAFQANQGTDFIKKLETTWNRITHNAPFQYRFLDEQLNLQYQAEKRFSQIFISFSLLAILIASIGLYGLLAITLARRVKEIGIRKVLGAGVMSILFLLSKDYMRLVLLALIISTPIVYYFINGWLEGFAYHIDIQWWIFAVGGLLAMLVAFMTVSFQSIKSALANPVNSLRNE